MPINTRTGDPAVVFRTVRTADGSGVYWAPTIGDRPDREALKLLDNMGHPPDTDSWIDPPTRFRGWYDPEVIGGIIADLTEAGYDVRFGRTPLKADAS